MLHIRYIGVDVRATRYIYNTIFIVTSLHLPSLPYTGLHNEDEVFITETTVRVHTDTICNLVEDNHVICDYFMVENTVGVFLLFSGLYQSLNLPITAAAMAHNLPHRKPRWLRFAWRQNRKGQYLYGKVLITHDFCVQGSAYDHLIPPLPSQALATRLVQPGVKSQTQTLQLHQQLPILILPVTVTGIVLMMVC